MKSGMLRSSCRTTCGNRTPILKTPCLMAKSDSLDLFRASSGPETMPLPEGHPPFRHVRHFRGFEELRKRAEYGFGEYGFKHRAQGVKKPSASSGERSQ